MIDARPYRRVGENAQQQSWLLCYDDMALPISPWHKHCATVTFGMDLSQSRLSLKEGAPKVLNNNKRIMQVRGSFDLDLEKRGTANPRDVCCKISAFQRSVLAEVLGSRICS